MTTPHRLCTAEVRKLGWAGVKADMLLLEKGVELDGILVLET